MSGQLSGKVLAIFGKGMCVGGTMLVPGVSGGSMAMILGIYDRLITSVSSFRKQKKESFCFLSLFTVGALLGMVLLAKPILDLIESYPTLLMYFFMGVVSGSIPMIYRKAQVKKFSAGTILYPMLGIVLVFLFSALPQDLFSFQSGKGILSMLMLVAAGILAAAALVLPGISVSYLLLMLGMYQQTMEAIHTLDFSYLLPLGIGLMLGILLTTKFLEHVMGHYTRITYLMILGFVIGSVAAVFPGIPQLKELVYCAASFLSGVLVLQLMFRFQGQEEK